MAGSFSKWHLPATWSPTVVVVEVVASGTQHTMFRWAGVGATLADGAPGKGLGWLRGVRASVGRCSRGNACVVVALTVPLSLVGRVVVPLSAVLAEGSTDDVGEAACIVLNSTVLAVPACVVNVPLRAVAVVGGTDVVVAACVDKRSKLPLLLSRVVEELLGTKVVEVPTGVVNAASGVRWDVVSGCRSSAAGWPEVDRSEVVETLPVVSVAFPTLPVMFFSNGSSSADPQPWRATATSNDTASTAGLGARAVLGAPSARWPCGIPSAAQWFHVGKEA